LGQEWVAILALLDENEKLQQWINDLQSGMYINCVYCGHRYGPSSEVPAAMADVLKAHIEQCPKHPMSALKSENALLRINIERYLVKLSELDGENEKLRHEVAYWSKTAEHICGDCELRTAERKELAQLRAQVAELKAELDKQRHSLSWRWMDLT
jgi:hypothetical protein